MLAYDPTTNRVEWIPMQGSTSDLLLAEEASTQELNNIVSHDPSEVPQRIDCFGEQRDDSGMEEAMELGYQPGSKGEADSDSTDSPHFPRHAVQCFSSRHHWSSISWVDQCPSKSEDQHMPRGARDTSHKTIEESEGVEQPAQPASP